MEKNMRKEIKDKISRIEGGNVCRLRVERGWTQEQLAEMLKTNVKYLSPIENGKRGIGPGLMQRLCEVFGVDEQEFQKGSEGIEREVNGDNYIERDIQQSLKRLPYIKKYDVAKLLREMLENLGSDDS